jgi:hypothetical protein
LEEFKIPKFKIYTSPATMGIMDVFILGQARIEDKILKELFPKKTEDYKNLDEEITDLLFIQGELINKLNKFKISGVSGIKNFIPRFIKINEFFRSSFGDEYEFVSHKMKLCGIQPDRIKKAIIAAGYTFVGTDDGFRSNINLKDFASKLNDEPVYNCIYAETEGANMEKIFELPFVNLNCTFSNDFKDLLLYFGIEAAAVHIGIELYDLILHNGGDIVPRHLHLLTDLMTNRGSLIALNYNGIKKQNEGILTLGAYERGFTTFLEASSVGSSDTYISNNRDILQVGSSILTGQIQGNTPVQTGGVSEKVFEIKKTVVPSAVLNKIKQKATVPVVVETVIEKGVIINNVSNPDLNVKNAVSAKESLSGVFKLYKKNI